LLWRAGEREAVALGSSCERCDPGITRLSMDAGGAWQVVPNPGPDVVTAGPALDPAEQRRAIAAGEVELRTVQRRQVFVDGKPVGSPF
jgi:hypothetical protein